MTPVCRRDPFGHPSVWYLFGHLFGHLSGHPVCRLACLLVDSPYGLSMVSKINLIRMSIPLRRGLRDLLERLRGSLRPPRE